MDSETGLYYLRARYMNPETATFTSMDSYAGNIYDPASLHRYLYANANPVKYTDPSGHKSLLRVMTAVCIKVILAGVAMACVMAELGGLVGAVSTAVQGGNTEQVVYAFMNGYKSGALLGAYLGMLSGFVAYCCSVSLIKASAFVVFGHDTSKALTELLFDGDLIKFAKQLPIIFMDYIFYRAACTSEPINLLPGYEGRKETLGNIFKKISESTGGEISSGNVGKGGTIKVSKSKLKHIHTLHNPKKVAQQLPYNQNEIREISTYFNKDWSATEIEEAVNFGYNEALKQGINNGKYTYTYHGENITVCLEDGQFKTGYGDHTYSLEDLLELIGGK